MRACVIHKAKDLRVEDRVERPLEGGEVRLRLGAGAICGSDLHYYFRGRVGDFELREPMVLGHEISGDVIEVGPSAKRITVGQRVAVNPGHPCGTCVQCVRGHENLCPNVRFFGSAARFPHVQGAFFERPTVFASQCHPVPDSVPHDRLVFAEPLAVAFHAAAGAGPLLGRKVLITGCGPIGVLVAMAARQAGAAFIAVTDVVDEPLAIARAVAADEALNVSRDQSRLEAFQADRGTFDVAFEASGNADALNTCVLSTRPAGTVVQIGMLPSGPSPVLINRLMAKELRLQGSFRFHEEFAWAVQALVSDTVDVSPLLTGVFPVSRLNEAFEGAGDRRRNMKVQIRFEQ
jgi:L-idonate 5-dehydrogenase